MRVVKLLVGHAPRSVGELIDETGVTRTAVTEQLNELMAAGFVERTVEKLSRPWPTASSLCSDTGRAGPVVCQQPAVARTGNLEGGRREWRRATDAKDPSFGQPQHVGALSGEDHRIQSEEASSTIRGYPGRRRRHGRSGRTEWPYYDHQTILRFISMFDNQRHVCAIDLELMSAIAGCPVRLTACRHDGASYCQFEVNARAGKEVICGENRRSAVDHDPRNLLRRPHSPLPGTIFP